MKAATTMVAAWTSAPEKISEHPLPGDLVDQRSGAGREEDGQRGSQPRVRLGAADRRGRRTREVPGSWCRQPGQRLISQGWRARFVDRVELYDGLGSARHEKAGDAAGPRVGAARLFETDDLGVPSATVDNLVRRGPSERIVQRGLNDT